MMMIMIIIIIIKFKKFTYNCVKYKIQSVEKVEKQGIILNRFKSY